MHLMIRAAVTPGQGWFSMRVMLRLSSLGVMQRSLQQTWGPLVRGAGGGVQGGTR